MPNPAFYFKNTTLKKSEKVVLSDFSWEIKAGENWAIVGPTGSGKTTLLEALAGKTLVVGHKQLPPVAYTLLVANTFAGHHLLGRALQYYQQRFNAHDADLAPTVADFLTDNIKPVGTIDAASVKTTPAVIDTHKLLETSHLLQINHLLSRRVTSLSNGETRRTLLAKALLKNPRVLLLDNPFVGLDVASRALLHQVLNQVMARGVQVIMATVPHEIPLGVGQILTLPPPPVATANAMAPQGTDLGFSSFDFFENAVLMRQVNVQYGAVKILHNFNWQVKRGEKWAVLGPNGAGKSTLLSLITADNPQGYANDYDLFDRKRGSGESIWDIKKRIGFLSPELHHYFPRHYTGFQVVASGLFDRLGIKFTLQDTQKQQTTDTLQLLGLTALAPQPFGQLSAGQQRLLLLARALVKRPPLLILDEPCQGLDSTHVAHFKDIINQLCANPAQTLIYVSHYAHEIPEAIMHTLQLEAPAK